MSKENRKKNLVDPKLQYSIMRTMIIGGVLVCCVFLGGFYFFIKSFYNLLASLDTLTPEDKKELFTYWNQLLFILVAAVVFVLASLWMWSYYFTNKIVGPIFNISRKVDAFLAGENPTPIAVRNTDYFQELAEKINKIICKSK